MSKKKENTGRDYPGYKTMVAIFSLVERVIRPQMNELKDLGLANPVALRGALSNLAIGHGEGSNFYYVASLPKTGLDRACLPSGASVKDVAGSALRITFNDKTGRTVEVLAVPAASRRGVDAIIQDEPGIFGIAVDEGGGVRCTRAFKTAVALSSPEGRTAHLPVLRQPRVPLSAVCA